jgi:hypothetical protein
MSSRAACGAITVAEDKMHEASKMRNAGTTKEMTSYIRCFLQHARYKAGAALAMMVLLGLLEGSGLLLLLPLLSLLGLGEGHPSNLAASAIPALLRFLGMPFTLPQVLTDEVDRIGFGTQQMLGLLSTAGVALVQLVFAFLLAPALTGLAICCGGLLLLVGRPVTRRTEALGKEAASEWLVSQNRFLGEC